MINKMVSLYKFDKYEDYIKSQKRNESMKQRTAVNWKHVRANDIQIIKTIFPEAKSVLCIGCRHESEVQDFIDSGFSALGIDLFTDSELVENLDMHKIGERFTEHEFDICYLSHSLEHAVDPQALFDGLAKISKYGFYVVLPDMKEPDEHDTCVFDFMKSGCQDFNLVGQELGQFMSRKFSLRGCGRRPARGLEIVFSVKWE